MLIETISFRIFDFKKGTDDEFLIENTIQNQEMVFQNRHTHAIQFGQTFDFQFAREMCEPKFIQFGNVLEEAFSNPDNLLDIDDVDEMVGSF